MNISQMSDMIYRIKFHLAKISRTNSYLKQALFILLTELSEVLIAKNKLAATKASGIDKLQFRFFQNH
jgi:hypothetical protein